MAGVNDGAQDRRVGMFTEDLGFVWAKAQAARGALSKLRAGCQDFVSGEFSLVHGKTGWKVVSVRVENNLFEMFKEAPQKIKTLANVFALLRKLLTGEEANQKLFGAVEQFLQFLSVAKEEEVVLGEHLALLKILHSLGFLREDPELNACVSPGSLDAQSLAFIASRRAQMARLINESLRAVNI